MPPCLDIYVWIPGLRSDRFARFIDSYVDQDAPGSDRLASFERTFVTGTSTPADKVLLAERSTSGDGGAFSLYLDAKGFPQAIITVTTEHTAVLRVSLNDPDDAPETVTAAEKILRRLHVEFDAPAGIAGVELPPPQSRSQWINAYGVQLRTGEAPPVVS